MHSLKKEAKEIVLDLDAIGLVVTGLLEEGFPKDTDRQRFSSRRLYEDLYCERGNMENVLKQQVLDLHGARMSTHFMASNQLRLWLSTIAYLLVERLQACGWSGEAVTDRKHHG